MQSMPTAAAQDHSSTLH